MRNMLQPDRRQFDSNAAINLAVIRGVVGIAGLLAVGDFILSGMGRTVPEWPGNVILAVVSGLIGYLARDVKDAVRGALTDHDQSRSNPIQTSPLVQTGDRPAPTEDRPTHDGSA